MKKTALVSLAACGGLAIFWVGSLKAQSNPPPAASKNNPGKPPVHKPDQSALNRAKSDERNKQELQNVLEELRKTEKRNTAAGKQLDRLDTEQLQEDPAKTLQEMKDRLSPEDVARLKELQKKVTESPEAKKALEEARKKIQDAAASAKNKDKPTTTPPEKFGPSTFDQVPAPVPVPAEGAVPGQAAKNLRFMVDGNEVILPPSHDPAKPERALPPSDPRSRTYIVIGNAMVKTPNMVLEGDRIEAIASVEGGEGLNAKPAPAKKSAAARNSADPVQPGINASAEEKKPPPFERILASGKVHIVRVLNGLTQSGKGGSMVYNSSTDEMVLTDWPEAQEGNRVIVGTRKDAQIILVPKGRSRFIHCVLREAPEVKTTSNAPVTPNPVTAPRAVPAR